jgi:hypothetical protein
MVKNIDVNKKKNKDMENWKNSRLEMEIRTSEIEIMKKAAEAKKEKFTFFYACFFFCYSIEGSNFQ